MDEKQIKRWGNSLAVRFDKSLCEKVANLHEDDDVVITYKNNKIIIEKK